LVPYVTSHPGQLSLAIPPWVGAMSTSESRHTAQCTSPRICGLAVQPGVWLRTKEMEKSANLRALWLENNFVFFKTIRFSFY